MIDVIIPAYNAHDVIERAICSVISQDISDKISITIVDDCSDEGYEDIVKFYSNFISIKEIRLEKNSGPGVARQYGIDNSSNPYIIFLDSDDLLADCFSAKNLLNAMETGEYDVINGTIVIERENGTFSFFDDSRVWLHGKMYSRKYLNDKNIRFNETRLDEDNYFNNLVFLLGARECILGKKTAVWKYNENSLTRLGSGDYRKNPLYGFILNISMVFDSLIERNVEPSKIGCLALSSLLYVYYEYLISKNFDNVLECIDNLIKMVQFYDDYIKYVSDEEINLTFKSQFHFSCDENYHTRILNPDITFKDFLKLIVERGKKND